MVSKSSDGAFELLKCVGVDVIERDRSRSWWGGCRRLGRRWRLWGRGRSSAAAAAAAYVTTVLKSGGRLEDLVQLRAERFRR